MPRIIGKKTHITGKQARYIGALLATDTAAEAQEIVGICSSTHIRWQKNPVFVKAFDQAKREYMQDSLLMLQKRTVRAIDTLVQIMENKREPAGARVTAAKAILDRSIDIHTLDDLNSRVRELEEQLNTNI